MSCPLKPNPRTPQTPGFDAPMWTAVPTCTASVASACRWHAAAGIPGYTGTGSRSGPVPRAPALSLPCHGRPSLGGNGHNDPSWAGCLVVFPGPPPPGWRVVIPYPLLDSWHSCRVCTLQERCIATWAPVCTVLPPCKRSRHSAITSSSSPRGPETGQTNLQDRRYRRY